MRKKIAVYFILIILVVASMYSMFIYRSNKTEVLFTSNGCCTGYHEYKVKTKEDLIEIENIINNMVYVKEDEEISKEKEDPNESQMEVVNSFYIEEGNEIIVQTSKINQENLANILVGGINYVIQKKEGKRIHEYSMKGTSGTYKLMERKSGEVISLTNYELNEDGHILLEEFYYNRIG